MYTFYFIFVNYELKLKEKTSIFARDLKIKKEIFI